MTITEREKENAETVSVDPKFTPLLMKMRLSFVPGRQSLAQLSGITYGQLQHITRM